MQTYKIIHSSKLPVTLWYNGRELPPVRQVVYRVVHNVKTRKGVQYGKITYDKQQVRVYRKRVGPRWAAWEAVEEVWPVYVSLSERDLLS